MQDYNKIWTSEIIFWRLQMLLVGFTVWGIVCLKHSWKAMWTRLADWAAMSNSLPQRKDEPLCGLQRLAPLCGCSHVHMHVWGPAENKFTFFTFRTPLSRRSTSPLHHLSAFRRGRESISEVRVTYVKSLSGRHSFGARWNESGELSLWTRAFIQRLHRAIFQHALLTPPLRLLHVGQDLILCTTES